MKRLAILVLVALVACTGKLPGDETGFKLFYPSLAEICPGTAITLNPTWIGGEPKGFVITGIRFGSEKFETTCFSVDEENGAFSISGSENLSVGTYSVDISCSAGGAAHTFKDIITITLMKPVPDGIQVTPSFLEINVADVREGKVNLSGAVIEPTGEGFVEIKRFLLQNVYKDGVLANECKSWFSLDENTGEFSVVTGNQDLIPALYTFDFKLTTYKVGASDEAGLFEKALTVNVVSAPYDLTYTPAERKVEVGTTVSSVAPSYVGVSEQTVFSIKGITPEGGPAITIDPASGVLSIQNPSEDVVGNSYSISVHVTNPWGEADFEDAFLFRVISFIDPVTMLTYDAVTDIISGRSFTNAPTSVDGDDLSFSFVDLPDALAQLTIDATTGVVSCAEGVEITPGDYVVKVQAKNEKSAVTASFNLGIIANPNNFTYVRWGNNLGLEPISQYGNQFRIYQGSAKAVFPILESDIPDGRPVKYTLTNKTSMGGHGAAIKADGKLEIAAQAVGGRVWVHYLVITVQVGEDNDENKVIRRFPLFIDQCGYLKNGYKIEYTPFAVPINPRLGGTGPVPVIVDKDGNPANQPALDFRTNPAWYNLNGPVEHKEGAVNKDASTFLYCVWKKYFDAQGKPVNVGAQGPVSWWLNKDNSQMLSQTGAYLDGSDLHLVVNADRFVDDYGYGDGVFTAICRFSLDGKNPQTAASADYTEAVPLVIWFNPAAGE